MYTGHMVLYGGLVGGELALIDLSSHASLTCSNIFLRHGTVENHSCPIQRAEKTVGNDEVQVVKLAAHWVRLKQSSID